MSLSFSLVCKRRESILVFVLASLLACFGRAVKFGGSFTTSPKLTLSSGKKKRFLRTKQFNLQPFPVPIFLQIQKEKHEHYVFKITVYNAQGTISAITGG